MHKRRTLTPQFTSQIVLHLLAGEKRIAEVCREHQLTAHMVGNWKQPLLAGAPQVVQHGETDSAAHARIAALERMVGTLTMALEIAKKASSFRAGMRDSNGRSR